MHARFSQIAGTFLRTASSCLSTVEKKLSLTTPSAHDSQRMRAVAVGEAGNIVVGMWASAGPETRGTVDRGDALAGLVEGHRADEPHAELLVLAVPFRSGGHRIEPHLIWEVSRLSRTLRHTPAIKVELDGYTDTRGSTHFNQKLSERRVHAVRKLLVESGVAAERIRCRSHGKRLALYPRNDRDAHAFERRVLIRLTLGETPYV